MTLRLSLKTTGCKVNQADSDLLVEALADLPVEVVGQDEAADLAVINACTVTAPAERDGRNAVFRALRSTSGPVFLTGCLAVRMARDTGSCDLPDRVRLLPAAADRSSLIARIREVIFQMLGDQPGSRATIQTHGGRARPFVKIQDGCDHACAYCIVPRVRGPSTSVPLDRVRADFLAAVGRGAAEVVLTGVDLTAWGREWGLGLPVLIDALVGLRTGARIRLSSIEPHGLTESLVCRLAAGPDLCPHLHVPLQSGSGRILEAMNRPARLDEIQTALAKARRVIPGLAIGFDVIVGFPGETDADFAATRAFVEEAGAAYLHVFAFSPRPGTVAATLPGRIPSAVVRERSATLRALSRVFRERGAASLVGQEVEVVDVQNRPGGVVESLTGGYVRVLRMAPECRPGRFLIRVSSAVGDRVWTREEECR